MEERKSADVFGVGELSLFSKPAAGATPRSTFKPVDNFEFQVCGACATGSRSVYTLLRTSTIRASKLFPASEATCCMASSRVDAGRYWRCEARASRQSTAVRIRAPRG